MPKRSNAFQKLIVRIYKQMNVPGGKVEESAMVPERDTSTFREVDILLRLQVFGYDMKIAVECRGRKSKDDITWIDSLIGKYRDLHIDKVVAVTKSGLTPKAIEKAAANRIETLTLRKALEADWPGKFTRLGVAQLTRQDTPLSITVATSPSGPVVLNTETLVYDEMGNAIGTVEGMAQAIYRFRLEDINHTIKERALQLFKTLEDIKSKALLVEMSQTPTTPCYLLSAEGATRLTIQ